MAFALTITTLTRYDKQQRMMEDALDQKTATLIRLQKVAVELQSAHNVSHPALTEVLSGSWGASPPSGSLFIYIFYMYLGCIICTS